jgi:hypothetical protein
MKECFDEECMPGDGKDNDIVSFAYPDILIESKK